MFCRIMYAQAFMDGTIKATLRTHAVKVAIEKGETAYREYKSISTISVSINRFGCFHQQMYL